MRNNSASTSQEKSIGFLLYRTSLAMRQLLQKEIKSNGYDITAEQWGVLSRLWEEDGLSQNEIATKLCKQRPNITRILDELEKNELVIRKSIDNDRRKYVISLTDKGKDTVIALKTVAQEIKAKACEDMSEQEVLKTIETLNKIYSNIGKHIKD